MEASQRHDGTLRPRSTGYLGRPSPGRFLRQRSPASSRPKTQVPPWLCSHNPELGPLEPKLEPLSTKTLSRITSTEPVHETVILRILVAKYILVPNQDHPWLSCLTLFLLTPPSAFLLIGSVHCISSTIIAH